MNTENTQNNTENTENTHSPAGNWPLIDQPEPDQRVWFAQMLTQLDEFLRTGDHVAHHLADFLSTGPGDTGQYAAHCFIDTFSFAAHTFRHADDASTTQPEKHIQQFPGTGRDAQEPE